VPRCLVGIDVGGTFTDFSVFDETTGAILALKVPSIPPNFAEGIRRGLERLTGEHQIDLGEIRALVHGNHDRSEQENPWFVGGRSTREGSRDRLGRPRATDHASALPLGRAPAPREPGRALARLDQGLASHVRVSAGPELDPLRKW
jgi:hypothetical protein